MLHTKRTNFYISVAAFVAYFISVTALTGGVVLCQDAAGASIEFACNHDHCLETQTTDHDSACIESADCQCASCPCEDSPLVIDMVQVPNQRQLVPSSEPLPVSYISLHMPVLLHSKTSTLVKHHPPPWVNDSLEQRQTVVLLV